MKKENNLSDIIRQEVRIILVCVNIKKFETVCSLEECII